MAVARAAAGQQQQHLAVAAALVCRVREVMPLDQQTELLAWMAVLLAEQPEQQIRPLLVEAAALARAVAVAQTLALAVRLLWAAAAAAAVAIKHWLTATLALRAEGNLARHN